MKKIHTFILTILFIFSGMTIISCKNLNSSTKENLDGYVANLSSYSSVGVATINKAHSNNGLNAQNNLKLLKMDTNLSYSKNEDQNKTCLAGVGDNNKIEEVSFSKKNNKIIPQLNVECFNQTKRYIIVTYTNEDVSIIWKTQFNNYNGAKTYIFDKETNLVFKFDFFITFVADMYGYGIMGSDCGDYFIIEGTSNDGDSYYKVGVVNGELKIQEIFKKNTIPGGAVIRLCDNYGNCIIERQDNKGYYVLNNQGKLIKLNQNLDFYLGHEHPGTTYKAVDGFIYNGNYVLNKDGEFVDASYIPDAYILPYESLVLSTETADYYFSTYEFDNNLFWFYPNTLIKVQKQDNEYMFEEIPFNVNKTGFQCGEFFYSFENDTDIIKTNILTGDQSIVSVGDNIMISSISVYDYNIIQFTGINEYMQTVKGIIYNDGTVSYDYEESNFITFSIQPIK